MQGVSGLVTDHIPLFSGVSQSAHGNAVDILIVLLLVVLMIRGADGTTRLPRTTLGRSIAWLAAAVLVGLLVGVAHHGSTRVALMEIRPYLYLAATYVLVQAFLGTRKLLHAALWVIVIASGAKGAAGDPRISVGAQREPTSGCGAGPRRGIPVRPCSS